MFARSFCTFSMLLLLLLPLTVAAKGKGQVIVETVQEPTKLSFWDQLHHFTAIFRASIDFYKTILDAVVKLQNAVREQRTAVATVVAVLLGLLIIGIFTVSAILMKLISWTVSNGPPFIFRGTNAAFNLIQSVFPYRLRIDRNNDDRSSDDPPNSAPITRRYPVDNRVSASTLPAALQAMPSMGFGGDATYDVVAQNQRTSKQKKATGKEPVTRKGAASKAKSTNPSKTSPEGKSILAKYDVIDVSADSELDD